MGGGGVVIGAEVEGVTKVSEVGPGGGGVVVGAACMAISSS